MLGRLLVLSRVGRHTVLAIHPESPPIMGKSRAEDRDARKEGGEERAEVSGHERTAGSVSE